MVGLDCAMNRRNIASGSPWESQVGYSRAVRVGDHIFVAGTTGTDEQGNPVGDLESQARHALGKIETALKEARASLADVVRTRMYVTDIAQWEAVGRVHAEFFGSIRPVATMVEVSNLIGDGIVVEIEVDAVVTR